MQKNIETGAKVINFLASCGREEVGIEDLFAAAVYGFKTGNDVHEAYRMVRDTLQELANEDMVSLLMDPSASAVPGVIRIWSRMRKTAERLMRSKPPAGGNGHKLRPCES